MTDEQNERPIGYFYGDWPETSEGFRASGFYYDHNQSQFKPGKIYKMRRWWNETWIGLFLTRIKDTWHYFKNWPDDYYD